MTQPFPPPPGRPEGRTGGEHLALGRAVVLLVLGVVVGVVCLAVGARPTVNTGTGAAPTTTTAPAHSTTTTTALKPSAAVKVLVANGGTVNGAAGFFADKLKADGWGTLTPTDTTASVTASVVYYAAGEQAPAQLVASSLGLPSSAVQPLSSQTPVSSTAGADLVLVVGPDLSSQVTKTTSAGGTPATSTTSATTTTTTTTPSAG